MVSALRIEALAVGGPVEVSGAGRTRARAKGATLARTLPEGAAVAVVGVGGGLDPDLVPGQLVVATELRDTEGTVVRKLPGADLVAAELRRPGLHVVTGPVVSSPTLVTGRQRAELAATGALVADMESAWLAEPLHDAPLDRRPLGRRHLDPRHGLGRAARRGLAAAGAATARALGRGGGQPRGGVGGPALVLRRGRTGY